MERRVFHGNITPADIAQALLAEFNQSNLRAQAFGESDNMVVQIGSRPGARSGGQTAMTVSIQKVADGIMVQLGSQAWLGVAASLGQTAISVFRNPVNLLGRLDDLAQDIESLQMTDSIWKVVDRSALAAGAGMELSERLSRVMCPYCDTANPIGEPHCIACGAPLGKTQPRTCATCGFILLHGEVICPDCKNKIS
ncbi:MAG: hypothetical protein JXA13_06815 [Anaerolineales bacterium]|nr:hypothetical protein [Anaerolineales bacterium]